MFYYTVFLSLCLYTLAHGAPVEPEEIQYLPPDRKLEIVETNSYRIGIELNPDLEIWNCSFISDTGLNCTFDVGFGLYQNGRAPPTYCAYDGQYLFENIVVDHGKEGLCQITVSQVQATGPKVWRLVAENYDSEIISNVTFDIDFFYMARLLSTDIRLMEFSNFVTHMLGFRFDDLEYCSLKFNNTLIELPLHSSQTRKTFISPYSKPEDEVAERVKSLGNGLCGLLYKNGTMTIRHLEWTLSARKKDGTKYRQTFKTRIDPYANPGGWNFTRTVMLGSKVTVPCGPAPAANFLCTMFDPHGQLVQAKDCRYTIKTFTMEHEGLWRCFLGTKNAMESLEYNVKFIGKLKEKDVATWKYESGDYLNMGCRMVNFSRAIQYCKMTSPDHRIYILQPTTATDRFLALGTDLNNCVCALQIKKPIQKHEKGRWLCEMGIHYQKPTGSPIIVGEDEIKEYQKSSKMTIQLGDPFDVYCEVPYFTEYCKIRMPSGAFIFPDFKNEILLGRCSHSVPRSFPWDNGTWTCLFGRKTGTPDDEYKVEITIADVLQYYKFVEADVGESVELMCSSGGVPLRHCRFVSPRGRGYQILNRGKSNTISYYGRGLEYGECGITIHKVSAADQGHWTCMAELMFNTTTREVTADILMDIDTTSNVAAISIGTSVAVVLVGTVVSIVLVRKWRQNRHEQMQGVSRSTNTEDNVSQGSHTNIFSMQSVRSYTNPAVDESDVVPHQHEN